MITKWNFQTPTEEELHKRDRLASQLGLSPFVCLLLVQRGLSTVEEVKKFFKPCLNDLHDPFLMPDMEKAVKRLNKALGNKEKILIYGDYDVDGTTAVSLVYKYLRPYSSTLDFYIPDRYDEGYGISYKGINYARENGITLVISLDCGIKAIEKIEYAKQLGIDFIICDHHMPDDTLPDAVAVLDAKRVDSVYPYEHLSGCGVGFKFMQAFAKSNNFPFADLEKLLELTAVSIASDIVPITGENRILAYYGLKQLNSNPSLGLKGIIDICGLSGKEITISDIVFKIGPRINASGRMMNGKEAVELLLAKDVDVAREKSESINQYNEERRELDKKITDEANAVIDEFQNMEDRKAIIVYNPGWHKGVIGIVASRLTEKYYRPAVVLTKSSELITGSARSVTGFDIYKAIESCRDLLENFGGHMYAAGLTMRPENVGEFTRRFNAYVEENIDPQMLVPQVDIDSELLFSDITPAFRKDLNRFQPFGPGNTAPVFATCGVSNHGDAKLVGMECEHLRMDLMQRQKPNTKIQAIAFQQPTHYEWVRSGRPIDVCYQIVENHYRGTVTTQLRIKDIKPVLNR